MALITEDGTGKANAESLVSVADFDAYLLKVGKTLTGTVTDDQKEDACRVATTYIVVTYGAQLRGRKKTSTQALPIPREGMIDDDGYEVSSTIVPPNAKDATSEMAWRQLEDPTVVFPDHDSGDIAEESVTVGQITERIKYAGSKSQLKTFPLVEGLMASLIESTSVVYRG